MTLCYILWRFTCKCNQNITACIRIHKKQLRKNNKKNEQTKTEEEINEYAGSRIYNWKNPNKYNLDIDPDIILILNQKNKHINSQSCFIDGRATILDLF